MGNYNPPPPTRCKANSVNIRFHSLNNDQRQTANGTLAKPVLPLSLTTLVWWINKTFN